MSDKEVVISSAVRTPIGTFQGALSSLSASDLGAVAVKEAVRRAKAEPEYTVVGGILRFQTMAAAVEAKLGQPVNVPEGDLCQYVCAVGASVLGFLRLEKIQNASPPAQQHTHAP